MFWKYHKVDALPCLAWCLHARRDNPEVTVLHGSRVEVRPVGFVEGAWDGTFADFEFHRAVFVTGSGAHLADDGVLVVASSSKIDAVFLARRGNSLFASNSLVFLLRQLDDAPHPAYPLSALRFRAFHKGSGRDGRGLLKTRDGVRIDACFAHNLLIRTDLSVEMVEQSKVPAFSDFVGYHDPLQQAVARLVDNAAAPQRLRRYGTITSLSQGYDSAAVACLAARAGCRDSLSFYVEQDGRRIDSGAEIAAHLGLSSLEFPKDAYRSLPGAIDAEFESYPDGSGVVWLAMEEQLKGRMLFVGDFGDNVWTLGPHRSSQANSFMTCKEFRLRLGFFVAAPAYLAAHVVPTIKAMAASDEMAPWRVDSHYNRPIPRRIIEESGVPGSAIADTKRAHGHIWSADGRSLTEDGHRDYREFLRRWMEHGDARQHSRSRLQYRAARATLDAKRGVRKRLKRLRKHFPNAAEHVLVPRLRDWEYCFLFQWGVERTRTRYEVQSAGSHTSQQAAAAAPAG